MEKPVVSPCGGEPADIDHAGAVMASALDILFLQARTHHAWSKRPVDQKLLRQLYSLAKWGPTAANSSPMRIVFICGQQARERLVPCLHPENVAQTLEAPVTAVIGYDKSFHELIPRLFPIKPELADLFKGDERLAFQNGSLQGGYFIIAARALGLDCGPMTGFDREALNAEFFPDGRIEANFLCNLGYGDPARLLPRSPRLEFDEACRVI